MTHFFLLLEYQVLQYLLSLIFTYFSSSLPWVLANKKNARVENREAKQIRKYFSQIQHIFKGKKGEKMPHFLLCHHSAFIFLNLEMLRRFYHNRIFLLTFLLLLCCFPISPHIKNLLLLSFWEKPWTGRQCGNKNVRLLYRQGSLPGGKKKKGERKRKSTKHLKKNMTFLKILSGKEKMRKWLFLGSPNTRGHQMEFSGNVDETNKNDVYLLNAQKKRC